MPRNSLHSNKSLCLSFPYRSSVNTRTATELKVLRADYEKRLQKANEDLQKRSSQLRDQDLEMLRVKEELSLLQEAY